MGPRAPGAAARADPDAPVWLAVAVLAVLGKQRAAAIGVPLVLLVATGGVVRLTRRTPVT